MRWNSLVGAACAGLLCACAAPDYQPAASGAVARLHLVNFNRPHICLGGERHALHPDGSGVVSVNADRPVHLMGDFQRAGGQCETGVKFVPKNGQSYDIINEPRAERCVVTVMRHDPSAQYGLRLDTTMMEAPRLCR